MKKKIAGAVFSPTKVDASYARARLRWRDVSEPIDEFDVDEVDVDSPPTTRPYFTTSFEEYIGTFSTRQGLPDTHDQMADDSVSLVSYKARLMNKLMRKYISMYQRSFEGVTPDEFKRYINAIWERRVVVPPYQWFQVRTLDEGF